MKKIIFELLPKNFISQVFGILASSRLPIWAPLFKTVFYNIFKLNLDESERSLGEYKNLQDMFTRRLKPDAREIAEDEVVSPTDGVLSQCGVFDDVSLEIIQAKGKTYSLGALLGDTELAKSFEGGMWATIYLSPFNYHRIHTAVEGEILEAIYVPGTLWPVNEWSVEHIEKVFCVNERVTSIIKGQDNKLSALCKVGATNVGKISLSYTNDILCNTSKMRSHQSEPWHWKPEKTIRVEKSVELGCFELGSTVVLILDKSYREKYPNLFSNHQNKAVLMGQSLL